MKLFVALALSSVFLMAAVAPVSSSRASAPEQVMFDDFTYANKQQMKKNGWILRTEAGWPGVPGAVVTSWEPWSAVTT